MMGEMDKAVQIFVVNLCIERRHHQAIKKEGVSTEAVADLEDFIFMIEKEVEVMWMLVSFKDFLFIVMAGPGIEAASEMITEIFQKVFVRVHFKSAGPPELAVLQQL